MIKQDEFLSIRNLDKSLASSSLQYYFDICTTSKKEYEISSYRNGSLLNATFSLYTIPPATKNRRGS